jgi:anti-anti-sigma factor
MDRKPAAMASSHFSIDMYYSTPPQARLRCAGDLDLCASLELSEQLATAVNGGCLDVTVDLSRVSSIDASCLDVLMSLRRRLRAEGGSAVLAESSDRVRRFFDLLNLSSVLEPPTSARLTELRVVS